MKLSTTDLKETPPSMEWALCTFGEPKERIAEWIECHNFATKKSGPFTNIIIPTDYDLDECFALPKFLPFDYIDGFSPNLNKHLHLGHVSNFVLAKAFQCLGSGKKFVAILGDTLSGAVEKEEALSTYEELCQKFGYRVDETIFASGVKVRNPQLLHDGSGPYEGTKVFNVNDEKVVGIKSSGDTTYFYQDVALAEKLNGSTLYLTGFEQKEHFQKLADLFPTVHHLPLGLVMVNGKKMSSREGNVVYLKTILDALTEKLGDDPGLVWNVLAGFILKSAPGSLKNIDFNQIDNVKQSAGLYLSYTLAKLQSAGIKIEKTDRFSSIELQFKLLKSKALLQPNVLFNGICQLAKKISQLYVTHTIQDHPENQKMFTPLANDLALGMQLLGLFWVNKV